VAELKTKQTTASVKDFLESVTPEDKRKQGFELLELFEKVTGQKGKMWGSSIVGFGVYHYKSEKSRQEGDWPLVGFSPRKQNLTLYIKAGNNEDGELMKKLGKHKYGVGCVYINNLEDVDIKVVEKMIETSYEYMKKNNKVVEG